MTRRKTEKQSKRRKNKAMDKSTESILNRMIGDNSGNVGQKELLAKKLAV
jgi:hypothetical protein